jgi:hypothetical protein
MKRDMASFKIIHRSYTDVKRQKLSQSRWFVRRLSSALKYLHIFFSSPERSSESFFSENLRDQRGIFLRFHMLSRFKVRTGIVIYYEFYMVQTSEKCTDYQKSNSRFYDSQLTSRPLLNGCASVLKTHSSKLICSTSSNIRYKYFSVSANQKLSCSFLLEPPPGVITSRIAL